MTVETKILMVNPIRFNTIRLAYYPLGLAYVASSLLEEGYKVEIIDADAYRYSKENLKETIKSKEFDVFATGGIITDFNYINWLCDMINKVKSEVLVVVGGGLASCLPKYMLNQLKTDFLILGEGENRLPNLLRIIENNGNLSNLDGIAYKSNNNLIVNNPQNEIEDLDSLPFPAYKLLPTEEYAKKMQSLKKSKDVKTMALIATRSCPYNCSFCYHPLGQKPRMRSIENIINEIKFLIKEYDIKSFMFRDELFTMNKEFVNKFCKIVIKRNLDITWSCNARVDKADLEMFKNMKAAGCDGIFYGIESGSDKILKNMKKGITSNIAQKAIRIAREAGFEPKTSFLIGARGENKATIQQTKKFIEDNDLFIENIGFVTPYPASDIFFQCLKEGKIDDLDKFIRNLGSSNNLIINMTELSDDKLKSLRNELMEEVKKYYLNNNAANILKKNDMGDKVKFKIKCYNKGCQNEFYVEINDYDMLKSIVRCPYCTKVYKIEMKDNPHGKKILNRLRLKFKELLDMNRKKLLIFGAGNHTKYLLRYIDIKKFNFIGFIDSDQSKVGTKFLGKKVYSKTNIKKLNPDVILISSYFFEEEIYSELKDYSEIEIIKIYN